MSYFVRKIWRSKWNGCDTEVITPITADAITNCLRTSGNTLSVWYAEKETDIDKAKVALLGALQQYEAIDLVVLDAEELAANELTLVETDGITAAKSLVGLHRDIAMLSIEKLGKVAKLVQAKVVAGKTERIMKGQFQRIIKKAVADNIIDRADLPEKLSRDL